MIRASKKWMGLLSLAFVLALTVTALAADTKGKIKSVDADKSQFVFSDSNGKNWTMSLGKTGKVFLNDKESKLSNLQAGDEAIVTYEKDGENLTATVVRCTRK
jgi:biopolymer transport protein ExbD